MIRWMRMVVYASLCACGPSVGNGDGSGSGSASSDDGGDDKSSADGNDADDSSDEGGSPPVECRDLPAQLAPVWEAVLEPGSSVGYSYYYAIAALDDGGAVVANEAAMLVLDATGAHGTVQWPGGLVPGDIANGRDGLLWVSGRDDELVVARYDATGELARGTRPLEGDEYIVDLVPEPDGGALVLTIGESWRVARIEDDLTFGDPSTIASSSELPWMQLRPDGIVLATTRDADGAGFAAFDRNGEQLWRTLLPMPIFEESYQLTSQAALGDVGFLHVAQQDYAQSPPQSSYWLFGTDRDDGTLRFDITTAGGPIAATPCGGLYRIEPPALSGTPPRLLLVEYDARGEVRGQTELAVPVPPDGYFLSIVHGVVVAPDGGLVVYSHLPSLEGLASPALWIAKF